jgi:ATP-dependent Clp protease ATP-binding subunit ClpA
MPEPTGPVAELMQQAAELADAHGHARFGTEHVLLALLRQSPDSFARRLLDEVGATEELRARIEAAIGPD